MPRDQLTDAGGQGQGAGVLAGTVQGTILVEGVDRLHRDERIALAHRPDLLLDTRDGAAALASGADESPDESASVRPRQRRKHYRGRLRQVAQILHDTSSHRALGELF